MDEPEQTIPTFALRSTVARNVNARSEGGRWSNEAKMDVVQRVFLIGNIETVAALTGVDSGTIRSWQKQEWWKEAMATLRYEQNQQTDVKLQKVVDKSLDIVADRLEHGDLVLNNKTGEL